MLVRRCLLSWMILCFCIAPLPFQGQDDSRRFGVKDSIEMVRFSDPIPYPDQPASHSPDGRFMVVVTSRGIIRSNQIESTIWLWKTQEVLRYVRSPGSSAEPRPRALVIVSSVPNMIAVKPYIAVVSDLKWSPDSQHLYFLGQDSDAERRLYRADITSGRIQILTPRGCDVRQFDFSRGTVVYTSIQRFLDSKMDWSDVLGDRINVDAIAVTGMGLETLLLKQEPGFGKGMSLPELWFVRDGVPHHIWNSPDHRLQPDIAHAQDVLSLSPNGDLALRLVPVTHVPKSWALYDPKPGLESWRINLGDPRFLAPNNLFRLRQYQLIDLRTQRASQLIDAPFADALANSDNPQVVWSKDGRRILLTNTFLPLDGVDELEQAKRRKSCAVVSVDRQSHATRCVFFTRDASMVVTADNPKPLRVQAVSFGKTDDDVVAHLSWHEQWGQTEHYHLSNGTWHLMDSLPADRMSGRVQDNAPKQSDAATALTLTIKQSLNDPPTLWATDKALAKSVKLWDPNPAFAQMQFGKASEYHWRDNTGYEWTGILVKPVDYIAGHRYPLIIQTHGISTYAFITDGIYPTAMAARPLASVGFVVLQTTYRFDETLATPKELPEHVEEFSSAIDHLNADGLIDRAKVGIIGFSRTCYHVEGALTAMPQRFAAATVADGIDEGYFNYLTFSEGRSYIRTESESLYGGKPFGGGLKSWLDLAPSFHLDRISTPLRIEAFAPGSILMEWGLYSALKIQDKPVDLIYLPDGQHLLQRPLQRLASQQGNVDWFRFWLQGYQDPDPLKEMQYRRWNLMRTSRGVHPVADWNAN
jgi:dipeptidyl aminopeptidase/acylaminoacyl peptidase